ncbi:MAG: hypothetical protein MJZ61_03275 [Bacteroidales bacterium]|nr:hypothetical protein [Bacteroidales bacterium]
MIKLLKIFAILSAFVLGLSSTVSAQYTVEWAQTYGGDGWDEANTCLETRDGDYVLGGFAKLQQHNLWVVKVHSDGRARWGKTFTEYFTSACNSMVQDKDSNLVLTGYAIRKRDFQSNLLIMKIDTLGNVLWHKTYGGEGDEEGTQVIATSDGGYAVAGFSSSNPDASPNWYILKVDHDGNMLWEQQFGSSNEDKAMSISQCYDGGLVVTGYIGSENDGQKVMSIVKLDKDGHDEWTQYYDLNNWSCGTAIVATRDSLIMAAGYTRAFSITDYDVFLLKCQMNGDTIWTRTYGNENWEEATALIETYDNAFVISGFNMSNVRDHSSFLMLKYDAKGNLMWERSFKRKSQDYAKFLVETRDNGLLLAGTTFSLGKGWDMAALKMKNNERTDLFFSFPTDSLSTTLLDKLTFRMCLNSFGIPNKVKVTVNGEMQIVDSEFHRPSPDEQQKGCDFPLEYTVDLYPGYNRIRLEIHDYKNYSFEKEIDVYRLPGYDFVR